MNPENKLPFSDINLKDCYAYGKDKIGWKKFVYITLPLACLFFQLGKDNIYALAFGVACLQSSVPITLLLMSKLVCTLYK